MSLDYCYNYKYRVIHRGSLANAWAALACTCKCLPTIICIKLTVELTMHEGWEVALVFTLSITEAQLLTATLSNALCLHFIRPVIL